MPGSIVSYSENKYKISSFETGLHPDDKVYSLEELPVVKACSRYMGLASPGMATGMVLVFNAEDHINSQLQFVASPTLEGLQGYGGNCPSSAQSPDPAAVRHMPRLLIKTRTRSR